MNMLKMCGPQIRLCLFTFRPVASRQFNSLTRWCSGNASDLGARGPGFNSRLRQGFLTLIFLFSFCCGFTFVSKTHYLPQNNIKNRYNINWLSKPLFVKIQHNMSGICFPMNYIIRIILTQNRSRFIVDWWRGMLSWSKTVESTAIKRKY